MGAKKKREGRRASTLEPLAMGKVGDGSGATPGLTMGWSCIVNDIHADAIQPVDVLPAIVIYLGSHDAHGI
jgi:hypothetical protein